MKKAICLLLATSILFSQIVAAAPNKKPRKPRNIILMVGDGTGLAALYAAYTANGGSLTIYEFAQYIGLSITASFDAYITDSAAGATAFASGQKTRNNMVGVAPDSSKLETITEKAEKRGLSTGVVVTCELMHATPAAFFAHQPHRNMYPAIANDMSHSNMNVLIGGGFPFCDTSLLRQNGFEVSVGAGNMLNNHGKKQVCFYNTDSIPAKYSRGRGDVLQAGSMHAISELSKNKKGFFLMVEGSQIDWGGHDNDSAYVIDEALDFDRSAKAVLEWAKKDKNTLVIITADHECGGLTLTGFDNKNMRPVMDFSTIHHTAEPVPVYAFGPGAEQFAGVYQNTDIYWKMLRLLGLD